MDQPPPQVVEIAANLDDASGEVVGHAIDTLLAEGALDCWATPIVMKKSRPAVTLCVLADTNDADRLSKRVIELTGSFGVRMHICNRLIVERRHEQVDTPFGSIRLKVGRLDGADVVAKVEFDDAAAAAHKHGVPPRQVMDAAMAAWRAGGAS